MVNARFLRPSFVYPPSLTPLNCNPSPMHIHIKAHFFHVSVLSSYPIPDYLLPASVEVIKKPLMRALNVPGDLPPSNRIMEGFAAFSEFINLIVS